MEHRVKPVMVTRSTVMKMDDGNNGVDDSMSR